jgi:hypothetical protein
MFNIAGTGDEADSTRARAREGTRCGDLPGGAMEQTWDLWIENVGSTGFSFARSVVDDAAAGDRLLVHAAPERMEVTVRDESGAVVARGTGLERHADGPMCFLVMDGATIRLEDGWPGPDDIGRLVILPGGECGVLTEWWHADDESEWRWSVEFYNHT